MKSNIDPPDPSYYGWNQHESRFVPHWTDLPPISAECTALLKCGCKNMQFCLKNYRCKKVWKLPCTHLCYCKSRQSRRIDSHVKLVYTI